MCSCEIYPDPYREELRTARKNYWCIECQTIVRPGDKYVVCTGLYDGNWHTFKRCQSCHLLATLITNLDGFECLPFGGLLEEIHESRIALPLQSQAPHDKRDRASAP